MRDILHDFPSINASTTLVCLQIGEILLRLGGNTIWPWHVDYARCEIRCCYLVTDGQYSSLSCLDSHISVLTQIHARLSANCPPLVLIFSCVNQFDRWTRDTRRLVAPFPADVPSQTFKSTPLSSHYLPLFSLCFPKHQMMFYDCIWFNYHTPSLADYTM